MTRDQMIRPMGVEQMAQPSHNSVPTGTRTVNVLRPGEAISRPLVWHQTQPTVQDHTAFAILRQAWIRRGRSVRLEQTDTFIRLVVC